MSLSTYRSTVQRLQQEIAQLLKQRSDETKREADKHQRIMQVKTSITKSTPMSVILSKERDIARFTQELAQIQSKQAEIDRKLADKTTSLHKAQQDLSREEERERKKAEDEEKRRSQSQLTRQKEITRELERQKDMATPFSSGLVPWSQVSRIVHVAKAYDVFISHASEDKDEFVRPLAEELQSLGFEVWYDEFTLKVGDNLRRSIDSGLANARYGVVVLSGAFFAKKWPQYELDGLVTREMSGTNGQKVILPIWHRVTKDEVMSFSPSLADKVALSSSNQSIKEIAQELAEVLRQE